MKLTHTKKHVKPVRRSKVNTPPKVVYCPECGACVAPEGLDRHKAAWHSTCQWCKGPCACLQTHGRWARALDQAGKREARELAELERMPW